MKREERREAEGDGDLSNAAGTEEERTEPAEEPVAHSQAGRPPATSTKHDELLPEQEILRDHRSDATGSTQLRGHDREVEQDEQEVLHARLSVGQTLRAPQRCAIRKSARKFAIRDPQGQFDGFSVSERQSLNFPTSLLITTIQPSDMPTFFASHSGITMSRQSRSRSN